MSRLSSSSIGWIATVILFASVGCTRKTYELHLTAEGETMHRTLTVKRKIARSDDESNAGRSPLSESEIAHMREFYDPTLEEIREDSHTFVGHFENEMPADVGGTGSYAFFESPLGTTSLYSERFRGEDDLQQVVENRQEAVDRIVDLLVNWSQEEFAGEPIQVRVESLLDEDIRRDLKNLSAFGWAFEMVHDVDTDAVVERLTARAGLYLIERDYFSLVDLPSVMRIAKSEDQRAVMGLLRDTVIRKLQLSEDDPAITPLAILGDPERLAASLRASIFQTQAYQAGWAQYERGHPEVRGREPNAEDLDPLAVLVGDLFRLLPRVFFASTQVRVRLKCDARPFATNANWDPGEGVLEWSERIADDNIPAMIFAAWSLPGAEFQSKCFGETILADEPLAMFVYWYEGLSDVQRQQYDAFLDTLSPGSELVGKIEAFEFADNEDLAELPSSLLTKAIENAR
ncbi:hypothetical protein [Allorhodopirellula solitaria]|uniref:Uncharacterized protein n=1 Tax=Allorhodopirellula solitaria TaxID=2527987 RepID=A0A5C5WYI6_9BACT|nr:hypothetical protein [Allorhodopirellula solitaria]TWT55650.1 hypothetical protein CA85_48440 [Allorhodopirellula solitaria]